MNSFDRVRSALKFENPDQIPVMDFTTLDTIVFQSDVFPMPITPPNSWQPGHRDDEIGLFPHSSIKNVPGYKWKKPDWAKDPKYKDWKNQPHEEIDEWGCIWSLRGDRLSMGHPGRPSLPEWSNLDVYIDRYFLNPENKERYNLARDSSKEFGKERYRIILPTWGPLTVASNMRGFNTFLIDLKRNPDKVKYLLEQITDIYVKQLKMFGKLDINPNGVLMYEDLGTQYRPFMSPEMFREFYGPHYQRLTDTIHDLGGEFHHHCCGKIDKIIPLFMEWGLDALELDSPRMTGYPDLQPFRGKLMFWGCVNIQSIYIKNPPEEVTREVWHMVRNLGTSEGGFGAYYYPQPHHIQVPKENIKAFKKGIKKYGKYSKIPPEWWNWPVVEDWKENIVPDLPTSKS